MQSLYTIQVCVERSGLPVAVFCEREGISAASVYRWRGLLAGSRRMVPAVSSSSQKTQFVDLGLVDAVGAMSAQIAGGGTRTQIRLDLGGGLVVQRGRRGSPGLAWSAAEEGWGYRPRWRGTRVPLSCARGWPLRLLNYPEKMQVARAAPDPAL